jgi:hypothetical protein
MLYLLGTHNTLTDLHILEEVISKRWGRFVTCRGNGRLQTCPTSFGNDL